MCAGRDASAPAPAPAQGLEKRLHTRGRIHEAPVPHRFNAFIRSGYRLGHVRCCARPRLPTGDPLKLHGLQMTAWDCIATLFTYHNETINVASHLIPLIVHVAFVLRFPWSSSDPTFAALLLFEWCAITCMALSVCYHLFMAAAHDPVSYRALLNADLVGVCLAISGGIIGQAMLASACLDERIRIGIILGGFAAAVAGVLVAPNVIWRGVAFLTLIGSLVFFAVQRLYTPLGLTGSGSWLLGIAALFGGGLCNSLRIPERWMAPGTLDYAFNSHNLMHVLTGALGEEEKA